MLRAAADPRPAPRFLDRHLVRQYAALIIFKIGGPGGPRGGRAMLALRTLSLAAAAAAGGGGAAAAVTPAPAPTAVPAAPVKALVGRHVTVNVGGAMVCMVTNFGAKGDGKTDDTAAVQAAFDHCGQSGGGTVVIPSPGTFLIFSVHFTASNQGLHIEEGATLLGSDDIGAWKGGAVGSALIVANGQSHVAITGGGTVDGQGLLFWRGRVKNVFRPHTVDFSHVDFGLISGPTFTRNPNHVLELGCNNCELSHISVINPPSTGDCEKTTTCSHNTDAVDVHGSPFYIHNVNFTTGDDNVAVHANHTLVEDSYFGTGHGASIGSMCDETITNLTVRNVTFVGTTSGCKIKAHPGCHGHVFDIFYENLVMTDVALPIDLEQAYGVKVKPGQPPPPTSVSYERIHYSNISATGGGSKKDPAVVSLKCGHGLSSAGNCKNIVLNNVAFHKLGVAATKHGMVCTGVKGSATGLRGINDCLKTKTGDSSMDSSMESNTSLAAAAAAAGAADAAAAAAPTAMPLAAVPVIQKAEQIAVVGGRPQQPAAAPPPLLQPHSLEVVGAAGGFVEPAGGLRLRWGLRCETAPAHGVLGCRGLQQQSFRAVVTVAENGAVVHDSGAVRASSPFCTLRSPALAPDTAYSVVVSLEAGQRASAAFQTAMPAESRLWPGAEWISGGTQLRGTFSVPLGKTVKRATAYASGIGVFQMTMNGKNVSDSFLDPGFSTVPSWRMLYRAFDVTALMAKGAGAPNAVGVRLGQGKYGYLQSYCTPSDAFQPGCRAFLLSLSMEFSDGSRQNFTTTTAQKPGGAAAWHATTAGNPVFYTHLYHGEQYDARRDQPGWDTPEFQPSAALYTPVVAYPKAADLGPLSLFTTPPIRITESRAPERVYRANGTGPSPIWMFDFGQNWAGFATLRLAQKLPAGTKLTLRFAEIIHPDGSLFNTYCGAGCATPPYLDVMAGNAANQTDVYITKGVANEQYTPFSTYHGER
eukprot:SAG22_NODE_229_length_14598_cov_13.257052_6_plen_980_part_00